MFSGGIQPCYKVRAPRLRAYSKITALILKAFLLLLYPGGNASKLRFPQEIATLHNLNKGYS